VGRVGGAVELGLAIGSSRFVFFCDAIWRHFRQAETGFERALGHRSGRVVQVKRATSKRAGRYSAGGRLIGSLQMCFAFRRKSDEKMVDEAWILSAEPRRESN
jgi:hypothetical protein